MAKGPAKSLDGVHGGPKSIHDALPFARGRSWTAWKNNAQPPQIGDIGTAASGTKHPVREGNVRIDMVRKNEPRPNQIGANETNPRVGRFQAVCELLREQQQRGPIAVPGHVKTAAANDVEAH